MPKKIKYLFTIETTFGSKFQEQVGIKIMEAVGEAFQRQLKLHHKDNKVEYQFRKLD